MKKYIIALLAGLLLAEKVSTHSNRKHTRIDLVGPARTGLFVQGRS